MKIFNSLVSTELDARREALLAREAVVSKEVVLVNMSFIKRGGYKTTYVSLNDAIEPYGGLTMPIIKDDNRRDVYNYYNTQLTNVVNRKLLNGYRNIFTVGDDIKQAAVAMDEYDDLKALLGAYPIETMLNNIDFSMGEDMSNAINEWVIKEFGDGEDIIPVVMHNVVSTIYIADLDLTTNKRLENGEAVMVKEPRDVHNDIAKLDKGEESLVFTDKGTYVIDVTNEGNASMRKLLTDHYFAFEVNSAVTFTKTM